MKTLVIALSLMASSSFAGTMVLFPKYDGVSVNKLCDAGSVYRTIRPVQVCNSYSVTPATYGQDSTPNQVVCNSSHYESLTVAKYGMTCIQYSYSDADASSCLEYGYMSRPKTVAAKRTLSLGGESEVSEIFSYTIPKCN